MQLTHVKLIDLFSFFVYLIICINWYKFLGEPYLGCHMHLFAWFYCANRKLFPMVTKPRMSTMPSVVSIPKTLFLGRGATSINGSVNPCGCHVWVARNQSCDWLSTDQWGQRFWRRNQRLRVFVHFQLSTTWLNSTVGVEQKYWHERRHCSSGNDVLQTLIIL